MSKWLPEIHLAEIAGHWPYPMIPRFQWVYEDGSLLRDQLEMLLMVAMLHAPREILEVGTFMGQTTYALAACLPEAHIHTVDLPPGVTVADLPGNDKHLVDRRVVGRRFLGTVFECRITQHYHDTLTWDFDDVGAPEFVFIDGAHTYEAVINDSSKAGCRAASGATFMWHDCDVEHPGVVKALLQLREDGMDIRRISGTALAYWSRVLI